MSGAIEVLLAVASTADREDAAAYAGRVARWDQLTAVDLIGDGDMVRCWAPTPFDVLAGRAVRGSITPSGVQVAAGNLLGELAVGHDEVIRLAGNPCQSTDLPPARDWRSHEQVPAQVLAELAAKGTELARHTGGPTAALLDSAALIVTDDVSGRRLTIPMRLVFALSGMGFAPAGSQVYVRSAQGWLRLDATFGSIARRNRISLPVFVD